MQEQNTNSSYSPDSSIKLPSLGNYEVILQTHGFYSLRDIHSGETIHSVIEPVRESNDLYVNQSQFQLLVNQDLNSPLIIWDVGLGAASNALAAIRKIEALQETFHSKRVVSIYSFENNFNSLKLAFQNPTLFPYIEHPSVTSFMDNGLWENHSKLIQWKLIEGDITTQFTTAPPPHLIYYDMYTYKNNPTLWSVWFFKQLFDYCQGNTTRFITYTVSTRSRSALLAAGFYVGYGVGTGPKSETTLAQNTIDLKDLNFKLLGKEWLAKWERSSAKTEENLTNEEKTIICQSILNHQQFSI